MAIKSVKDLHTKPIEIDLTGPNGNAFVLMSYARAFCKQLKKPHKPIIDEMLKCGIDIDRVSDIFEREFGDFVILYR